MKPNTCHVTRDYVPRYTMLNMERSSLGSRGDDTTLNYYYYLLNIIINK